MSTWDAMARAMQDRLLPQRTLNALEAFRRLIEDARAMLGAGFAEKLTEDVHEGEGSDASFDVAEFANDGEEEAEPLPVEDGADEDAPFDTSFNFSFDFGLSEEISTIAPENARGSDEAQLLDATSFNPFAPVVLKESVGQKKNGRSVDSTTFRSG